MRIYDEKAARIISIIYHGGPDAFRHLEGILRETKQECPEALEDVWRYCRNNAPVPGIPWEAALRDELFGGWDEDERKEDVAELEALHVPEEEAGDIFRQMLDDEWETKQELRRRNIAFSANTNAVEDMEKAFAEWQAERAKGPPSSRHRAALHQVPPPWIRAPGDWEQDGKGPEGARIMRRKPVVVGKARHAVEPPREVIIPGVMEIGRVTGFIGKAEFGKSILAMGTGASIATGCDWFGVPVKKKGPVLILDNEMPENSIFGGAGRIAKLLPENFDGPLCVHPMFDEMAWNPEARIRPEVHQEQPGKSRHYTLVKFERYLEWVLERLDFPEPPVALILDGAAQFYNGVLNEIASDEPRSFVDAFRALALRRALAVGLVLHTSKNPGEAENAARGGQGWTDTFDHTVVGTKTAEDPDPETGKLTDVRGNIEWGKARFGDKGVKINLRRHGLEFWQMDHDAPQEPPDGDGKPKHRKGTPRDYSAAKVRKAVPAGETVSVKELGARLGLNGYTKASYGTVKKWGEAAVADGVLEQVGTRFRGLPEAAQDIHA